jgi:Domain of unknown function (DUF4159)
MNRVRIISLVAIPLFLLCASLTHAQGFGRCLRNNQNDPPATEFIAARWHFGTNGLIRHCGWSHNYPYSELHLNEFVAETTRIDVQSQSYRIIELGSDDIFDHPFTYVSEPGEMELSEQEVVNLRQYIDRGGFILIDDFDGPVHLSQLRSQMLRVFPDRLFFSLTIDHPIFDLIFELQDLKGMAPYVPGGALVYYGMLNERGEVAIVACFNNDLANFWDRIDQGSYPLRPSTDAFRMGINYLVYSMTH